MKQSLRMHLYFPNVPRFLFVLLCSCASFRASAQETSRLSFGAGIEAAGKAQLLANEGSRYGVWGATAMWGALRVKPASEWGWTSLVKVGLVKDDISYHFLPGRLFRAERLNARTEFAVQLPTRLPNFFIGAAIGADWNIGQNVMLRWSNTDGEDLFSDSDLYWADLSLWHARRLLSPHFGIGAGLSIPTSRKPVVLEVFVRQVILSSYEESVVVTIHEDAFRKIPIVVNQRPTLIGLSASYFF